MAINLPRPPAAPLLGALLAPRPEVLYHGNGRVDYLMEILHITKRRVSGGILVDSTPDALWSKLTAFEKLPDFIPSIISHDVSRRADGTALIEQVSLLSRRMNLRTQMTLKATPSADCKRLQLQRTAGHGFLEFDAMYELQPRANGRTYLSYTVELVPCPIFPLPLVEEKIRKEVPRMLVALRDAVYGGVSPR